MSNSYTIQQIRESLEADSCRARSCYVWPADIPRPGQLTQGPCHCLENHHCARSTVTLLRMWIAELTEQLEKRGKK